MGTVSIPEKSRTGIVRGKSVGQRIAVQGASAASLDLDRVTFAARCRVAKGSTSGE